MLTLAAVHPITHAVANTIKRVILILFSVVRFGTPLTTTSAVVRRSRSVASSATRWRSSATRAWRL